MLELNDKVAVVTGGTSGIGLASARVFLQHGARVAICGRDQTRLDAAVDGLIGEDPQFRSRLCARVCDVLDPTQVAQFRQQVSDTFGMVDALVCNAGQGRTSTFESTTDAQWREEMDLKLFSIVHPVRAFHADLKSARGASIVCVNSLLARQPEPHMVATSAARAVVVNLVRSLAIEFAPDLIRVNSILLGLIDSGQWRRRYDALTEEKPPYSVWLNTLAEKKSIPLGRLGLPEEPARTIVFLASPWSSYTTGSSIDVSGGLSRHA